jgi:hypothetical protein
VVARAFHQPRLVFPPPPISLQVTSSLKVNVENLDLRLISMKAVDRERKLTRDNRKPKLTSLLSNISKVFH